MSKVSWRSISQDLTSKLSYSEMLGHLPRLDIDLEMSLRRSLRPRMKLHYVEALQVLFW
jgi:hypothetical protein